MREETKAAEWDAVGVLVNPFDLADGLDPRPTMGDIPPHEDSQIIMVNIVTSFTKQMKVLQMSIKKQVREELREVKQIPISV